METVIDSRAMNKKDKDEFNLSGSYVYTDYLLSPFENAY